MSLVVIKAKRRVVDPTLRPPSAKPTRNESLIAGCYRRAVKELRDGVDAPHVRAALARKDISAAVTGLPWDRFVITLQNMRSAMRSEFSAEAKDTLDGLRHPVHKAKGSDGSVSSSVTPFDAAAFQIIDDSAVRYAQREAGARILSLQTADRARVSTIISNSLQGHATADQAAHALRATIGLTPRYAAAVMRAEAAEVERLIRAGMSLEQATERAAQMAERYANRLLASRAETIARTEINDAANQGRMEGWISGVNAGYVDDRSFKYWIDEDGCDQCASLAEDDPVPWDAAFANGEDMPPAHPNCRCSAALLSPSDPAYPHDQAVNEFGSFGGSASADALNADGG